MRAIHEAGHAVVARKLGLIVNHIHARSDHPSVMHPSAGYAAAGTDAATQISGYEKDAMVALAGLEANKREYDIPPVDVLNEANEDIQNFRSAAYRIICLQDGQPVPRGEFSVEADQALENKIWETYHRLMHKTAALVERHWPAIQRVAKHLERHDRIEDQATLDGLIEWAEANRP